MCARSACENRTNVLIPQWSTDGNPRRSGEEDKDCPQMVVWGRRGCADSRKRDIRSLETKSAEIISGGGPGARVNPRRSTYEASCERLSIRRVVIAVATSSTGVGPAWRALGSATGRRGGRPLPHQRGVSMTPDFGRGLSTTQGAGSCPT